jgi:hypothetical protein
VAVVVAQHSQSTKETRLSFLYIRHWRTTILLIRAANPSKQASEKAGEHRH